jgi:hypothetical protein
MVIDDPSKMSLLTSAMKKQIITAAINTVNIQAGKTRKNAIENVKASFILRNTFTTRQITYTPCPLGSVHTLNNVQASIGATQAAEYMARQEKGGKHEAKGPKLNIPTDYARMGSRSRLVYRTYRLTQAKFVRTAFQRENLTKKQRIVANAYVSFKRHRMLFVKGNIYKITTFTAGSGGVHFDSHMIYNRKYDSTETKAKPWLQPASEQPAADCQNIFNREMDKAGK